MSEVIRRRKLYQEVMDRLMARIQAVGPGEQLPSERELMEEYGVGRPAVREALQSLARSGIVEIAHGERARIVVPTAARLVEQVAGGAMHLLRMQPQSLEHLKSARLFLEMGMARLAAEEASSQQIASLRTSIAMHRASMANPNEFMERDIAFHCELAGVGGNPIFPAVVEATLRWASEYYRGMVRAPGAEELTLAEHTRIVDAVAAGAPDEAAEAMRAHLTRASSLYRHLIKPEL